LAQALKILYHPTILNYLLIMEGKKSPDLKKKNMKNYNSNDLIFDLMNR